MLTRLRDIFTTQPEISVTYSQEVVIMVEIIVPASLKVRTDGLEVGGGSASSVM